MRPPLQVRPLSSRRVAALEARFRRTRIPAERTRYHIILLSQQGRTPPEIAAIVRVDPATVRRTIHRYLAAGLRGLAERPRKVTVEWERLLVRLMDQDPRAVGVSRAAWTVPALGTYLAAPTGVQVSRSRIRDYLHAHGYVARRPTWTVRHLARRDPQYAATRRAPRRSK